MDKKAQCLADFEIEEVLGNTTMLVKNKQRQRRVLKQLKCCDEIQMSEAVERVKNLTNTCSHSYIVGIEDVFAVGSDTVYLVCQYCEGGSLHALIKRARQYQDMVNETEVIEWVIQMCLALRHLHSAGLVYNLLCPKNILLMNNCCKLDCTKLVSRMLNPSVPSSTVTSYSSPESVSCLHHLSESSDIWGLGCCLYELCALKRLFPKKATEKKLVENITEAEIPHFPEVFSQELANVWTSLMNRDPKQRLTVDRLLELPFVADHLKEMEEMQKDDDDKTLNFQDVPSNTLSREECSECGVGTQSDGYSNFSDLKDEDQYEGDESDFLTAEDIEHLMNPTDI